MDRSRITPSGQVVPLDHLRHALLKSCAVIFFQIIQESRVSRDEFAEPAGGLPAVEAPWGALNEAPDEPRRLRGCKCVFNRRCASYIAYLVDSAHVA